MLKRFTLLRLPRIFHKSSLVLRNILLRLWPTAGKIGTGAGIVERRKGSSLESVDSASCIRNTRHGPETGRRIPFDRYEFYSICALGLGLAFGPVAFADQPIFNEMPRWNNGWGIQFVREFREESDLMSGGEVVASGFSEEVDILHVEGVYTREKSIRATAKLPLVLEAARELPDGEGGKVTQHDEGVGDATFALPLKKYFNLDGRSGSWTLAPQVRVPLSGEDPYNVYDGAWGTGVSLGYDTETHRYLYATEIASWVFEGNQPFLASASVNLGLNFRLLQTSGHIVWETDFVYEDDGLETLYVGPHLYIKINDTVHTQVMYKKEVHSRRNVLDHGNGEVLKLGLAFVF